MRRGRRSPSAPRTPRASTEDGEDLLAQAFLRTIISTAAYITHISALKRDLMKRKIKKLQRAGDWS